MADAADVTLTSSTSWPARLRTVALWSLVGVGLVAFFTMLTFPFDALHHRLVAELARQTGLKMQVESRRPAWPLGLEWNGVRVPQGERTAVMIARARGVISWLDALQGRPVVHLSIWLEDKTGDPSATAKLRFADWRFERLSVLDGVATRVDLPKVAGPPVRGGRAKATWRFEQDAASPTALQGGLELDVNELSIEQINNQGFKVPEWGFSTVRGKVQCMQGICRVEEFSGTGPDGSLFAGGQLLLAQSPQDTRWDVTVTLTCSQSFAQRSAAVGGFPLPANTPMKLRLVGPLLRPQLSL